MLKRKLKIIRSKHRDILTVRLKFYVFNKRLHLLVKRILIFYNCLYRDIYQLF